MEAFIALVTAWFMASAIIPLTVVSLIVLWIVAENEKGGWSIFFTIVTIGLALAAFPTAVQTIVEFGVMKVVALYAAAGLIWASTKWFLKLFSVRSKFLNMKEAYLQRYNLPEDFFGRDAETLSDEDRVHYEAFAHELRDAFYGAAHKAGSTSISIIAIVQAIKPKASDNKASITMWAAYWPTSVLSYILGDLFKHIGEAIYRFVASTFQNMSDRMFKNLV